MTKQRLPQRTKQSTQASFAQNIIAWQALHGRNNLPWQGTRDPYRVWLSEIMLQQTQVSTVINYYQRFLQAFPSIEALAQAPQDAVLALWSGLGYYSRARNLHRCAQIVCIEHGGAFPSHVEQLEKLPGIGPSTAAAIAAFCFGRRVSIFDANVQRVMARFLACTDDLSRTANKQALWKRVECYLPDQEPQETLPQRMAAYTQALMDLGATVCTPKQPVCVQCPARTMCQAYAQGRPLAYPQKSNKLRRTAEAWWFLVLLTAPQQADAPTYIWLQKRGQTGIWGGLHCMPVFKQEAQLLHILKQLSVAEQAVFHAVFKHVLTHKDLYLHPVSVVLPQGASDTVNSLDAAQGMQGAWHAVGQDALLHVGLPAPVHKWLKVFMQNPSRQ